MKKLILITIVLLISFNSFSQNNSCVEVIATCNQIIKDHNKKLISKKNAYQMISVLKTKYNSYLKYENIYTYKKILFLFKEIQELYPEIFKNEIIPQKRSFIFQKNRTVNLLEELLEK